MSQEKEVLVLRVDLDSHIKELFFKLKEERNFKTNAETIRYCITEASERKEISVPSEIAREIQQLLKNKRISQKYQIFDHNEFVQRALETYILKIRKESGTLFTWSIRQKLSDNENAVAVAIIELQPSSHPNGVTIPEIVKKTDLSTDVISGVLKGFVDAGLVYEYKRNEIDYYYAPIPEDYEL